MRRLLFFSLRLLPVLFLAACASVPETAPRSSLPGIMRAEASLKQARRKVASVEQRAGFYLAAAEDTEPFAITGEPVRGREIYNNATAEVTALLRGANGGREWKNGMIFDGPRGSYRMTLDSAKRDGQWPSEAFDRFIVARDVNHRRLRKRVGEPGLGGSGVRDAGAGGLAQELRGTGGIGGRAARGGFARGGALCLYQSPSQPLEDFVWGWDGAVAADQAAGEGDVFVAEDCRSADGEAEAGAGGAGDAH